MSESLTNNDILAEFQDEDCNNKSDNEPNGDKTVPEECPTQPTEVRQAIDTLFRFSLFASVEADEIHRETSRLSSLVDRNLKACQRQKTLDSFLVSF